MIGRFAIDAHALGLPDGGSLGARLEHKRLAECILEFGLLRALGPKDRKDLHIAMKGLADQLGYDFWTPLILAIDSVGAGGPQAAQPSDRSVPDPPDRSVHDYVVASELEELQPLIDLVILGASGQRAPGLAPEIEQALYDDHGCASFAKGPELALTSAVDQSETVNRLKAIHRETMIPEGTLDTEIWDTYFRPLAQASTEVNIFDRYLFSGLIRTKQRRRTDVRYLQWFFNSLDRDLPSRATVNLFAFTGQKVADTNRDPNARPYSVVDIAEVIRGLDRWDRPGRLHLYLWDGLHHDRHLRFSSGHVIMPQQGLDQLQFPEGQLAKKFSYSFVPSGPSLTARVDEESRARAKGKHWKHKSKKNGFAGAVPTDTTF